MKSFRCKTLYNFYSFAPLLLDSNKNTSKNYLCYLHFTFLKMPPA